MTTNETSAARRRTYGGWIRPRSFGLWNLGLLGTIMLFAYIMVTALVEAFTANIKDVLIWLAIGAVPLIPLAYRDRRVEAGRHGWQIIAGHVAWAQRRFTKEHVYLPGRIGVVPFGEGTPLPGILASTRCLEVEDSVGKKFSLIEYPEVHHYALPIRVEPDGSALVDQDTVDTWVGHYDRWLAGHPREPGLVGATVTVESAPDPGHGLVAEADRLLDADDPPPPLVEDVLHQIAATYPAASASITGHVTLTYSATKRTGEERELALRSRDKTTKRVRSSGEMAARIGGRINGQLRQLAATGVGGPRPMTPQDTAEMVRIAYDPAVAVAVDRAHAKHSDTGITWANAGPAGAFATWDCFVHNNATSVTWMMVDSPHGEVESRVLEELLAPCDAVVRKRVTILYRPHSRAEAPTITRNDVKNAISRATQRKGEQDAGEVETVKAARKAAAEVASGAGLTRGAILVTATVLDPAKLDEAVDAVEQAGQASQIGLRRCYGTQDSAFQFVLGVGIVPTSHVNVPQLLRDKT